MFKVGGLFSGVGGIEQGFINAGFKVSWANEIDKHACITYRANHSHKLYEENIFNLNASKLEPIDILTGGFPCQPFSIAGLRKGFDDKRGNLFYQIMRLVDEMKSKPQVIFLENVKNFHTHDNGNTFKTVIKEMNNRGYSTFTKVLNTAEYTVIPHNRERIFIIGFKDELDWQSSNKVTCSSTFNSLFPPVPELNKFKVQDLLTKSKVEDRYYYGPDKYMYSELLSSMKNRDTVYQWRRKYVRENKSNVCPTLTANMGTGGHNVPLIIDDFGFRKLTPSECFRFQGFHDDFILPSTLANGKLYKQAGNSVSVPLIMVLAELIKSSLLNPTANQ